MEVNLVSKSNLCVLRGLAPYVVFGLLLQMAGCASVSTVPTAGTALPSAIRGVASPFEQWQHYPLPGKTATDFSLVELDGRRVMSASANASASMLRQPLRLEPNHLGGLHFSWLVPQLIEQADMAVRQTDDSPVRVVLAFDGDRSRFSMKNAMLSELSLTITGEPLPYATLMYVWCNTRPAGTVIINPRTDRIRKLVVESGPDGLNRWLNYDRNIRADFEKAFGEQPGALVGLGIMTDTDNTQTQTRAWYGPLNLTAVQ